MSLERLVNVYSNTVRGPVIVTFNFIPGQFLWFVKALNYVNVLPSIFDHPPSILNHDKRQICDRSLISGHLNGTGYFAVSLERGARSLQVPGGGRV